MVIFKSRGIIMNPKLYYIVACLANYFLLCSTAVPDEEYGLMPDIFQVEDFDSCMILKDKALYCEITYEFAPINPNNPPAMWKTIKEVSSSKLHYRHDLLRLFVCVPKSCPMAKISNSTNEELRKDLNDCIDERHRSLGFKGIVKINACKRENPIYEVDIGDWLFAIAFFSYMSFILLCTMVEYKNREDEGFYKNTSTAGKIILSFSIMSNWNKLKTVPTGPKFERLRPVQGLRVYLSILVILVHTGLSQVAIPVTNPKFLEDINDYPDFLNEIPKRGIFLLSFFFLMSAWMVIMPLLAKRDQNEDLSVKFVIHSIIKRYIRLLPTVAIIVGFYATWFRHIPFGPFFRGMCGESERCRKNWWPIFLFIQNHYDRYFMCHIVSWYLAVEMQYYIITLFLFIFILKRKISIPLTVGVLLTLNVIWDFLDHWRHGYPSTLSGRPEEIYAIVFNQKPQWHDHFANYHGNASGYILGLGFGYVFYTYSNKQIFDTKWKKIVWAILSFGPVLLTTNLPLYYDVDATPAHSAVWVALTKPLFSLGMGFMVLGLAEGLGGPLRSILNWGPLYVLGKLSFCLYIGHSVYQNIRIGIMRTPEYPSYFNLVKLLSSDVLIGFLGALWLSLFFEMPFNELVNRLSKGSKRPVEKKEN
ncbi:unnamed protein product [Diabrotica balteata]|uniref:Acyltransferase 3 domain-containing protein n=1 Tax=Diabrotica balteata TaxID=107213 RepID=A0A9P0GZ22_DIABA|nr:unnamed protein product [Diabrotica balteata]